MNSRYLHIVVFVCGASVLAIEILGTRILGPFYGVSIFLWSALISVTLAALSLGYMLGGYWADKKGTVSHLARLILLAGVWMLLIPWIKHPFLSLTEQVSLRTAVLLSSFVLFFPPLMLLGAVSPYAIKLKASSLNDIGRTSGNLYALSTIASVVSALLTGFYLIPNIGVNHLTLSVGLLLIVTAIILHLINKKTISSLTSLLIIIIAVLATWKSPNEQVSPQTGLLALEQSPYAELRVLDTEAGRHFLIDGGIHGLVDTSTWESSLKYIAVMDLPRYFFDETGSALLIGLGGGSLVKQYKKAFWNIDAVEIDPVVIRFAQEYFHLLPSDGTVTEMDGRQYLMSTKKSYDVILLDAFGSSEIPFHLVTKESFDLAATHLHTNGILTINVETIGWNDPIITTLTATLKEVFLNVVVLPTQEPPNMLGNVIMLASNGNLEPKREPERNVSLHPDWRYGPGYQKAHAWDNKFTPDTKNVRVLTDDLNNIDLRAEVINLAARNDLHRYFQESGMSW